MDLTIPESTGAVLVFFSERLQVFALLVVAHVFMTLGPISVVLVYFNVRVALVPLAVAPDPMIEAPSSVALAILYRKMATVLLAADPGVTILTPSSAVLVIL